MRFFGKIVLGVAAIIALGVAALAGWLYMQPPALIRVGSGYAAKIVCSNFFLADRQPDEVLRADVQAPGHWLLGYMSVEVDAAQKTATAGLLGVFGKSVAVAREGLGCAVVPDGDIARASAMGLPVRDVKVSDALWPEGALVQPSQAPEITEILNDEAMMGQGMRAVTVVHNGRIIGERYANGFAPDTPLLGWSMSKTVNAAIIGTLIRDGKLALDQKSLFAQWAGDPRKDISVADLMAMSSGLEFNEDYGDVTDVTRMLYLEPDMAGFAASKPLAHPVGSVWSYSSGTSNLLSRVWQGAIGDADAALALPRAALFEPLGMTSAVLETDARGTLAGSSYVYASAHDWARFGQFLLDGGVWEGKQILPAGFVDWMREPAPASQGEYGRGQLWLHGSDSGAAPGENPDHGFDLPADTFWLLGHDGQSVAIIPSKKLVVVRMGLTPSNLQYRAQGLVSALAKAVE
ncbi:serine hydrolase [Mesorhizobium sp. NBSH29]|uniref:serine hydrolase domain-containing protein n=1 Tax=Mesorhizobium sp. NBSH29 TaxID=2654249 RepID=UPI00189685E1|nr:serine hydrolase [Mesorhizobium sp. NBSH29]QPC88232.1 serine hydrolase [Mesorhizobium sp. NBSH29]